MEYGFKLNNKNAETAYKLELDDCIITGNTVEYHLKDNSIMAYDLDENGYPISSTGREVENVELTRTPLSVFELIAEIADKNENGFDKKDLKKLNKFDLGNAIVDKLFAEGNYNLRNIEITKKSIHLTMVDNKGNERNLEIEFMPKKIGTFFKNLFKFDKKQKTEDKTLPEQVATIEVGTLEEHPIDVIEDVIENNAEAKDTTAFLHALGGQETKGQENPYFCMNKYGYVGRYQMGEQAMVEMGIYSKKGKNYNNDWSGVFKKNKYGITSLWDYRNSPEKQEMLQIDYKKRDWEFIKKKGLLSYVGENINGVVITESGMLAGAHLVGAGGLSRFLKSDGKDDVKDRTGTPVSKYLEQFAGYDVSDITN